MIEVHIWLFILILVWDFALGFALTLALFRIRSLRRTIDALCVTSRPQWGQCHIIIRAQKYP